MKKNKLIAVLSVLLVLLATFNSTYAISIFDTKSSSSVYKMSEDDSDFSLPFARISEERIEIDKEISQVGLFLSSSSIETTKNLEGIQLLYSGDTIRINSNTEYPIIFSNGNVIINGTIEKSTFIYSNGSIILGEEANVKGTLICYAPKLEVNCKIDGNILGEVSTLVLNNVVSGKVKMNVYDVNFSQNAKVEKSIEINTTNKNLIVPETVGTYQIDIIEGNEKLSLKQNAYKAILAIISNFVIYLLFKIFIKKENLSQMVQKLTKGNIVLDGLKTYAILVLLIIFGIVLLPIIVKLGIAMIVVSLAILVVITLLKYSIFALFVSKLVEEKYKDSQYKVSATISAISTLVILELLGMIPYVGQIIKFIVFIVTLGILTCLVRNNNNVNKEEKMQPDTIVAK